MPQRISVRVPATSANLGCAFDSAAIALRLYLDVHVVPRKDNEITVSYRGVTPERIHNERENLIARTMIETLEGWRKRRGFDLEIDNQIPVGVGLGSSAAAIVAALAACHWLADTTLFDQELVGRATRLEGHPDNVSAAWHGGFTVAVEEEGHVLAYSAPVPDSLQFALVVPDYALATEKARAVLPTEYSRADTVHNLQRAMVLAAQLFAGKTDLCRVFFDDRLHQPYRAPLIPGLAEVLTLRHPDLLGVCVSGGGPAILAIVRANGAAVSDSIRQTLQKSGIAAQSYVLSADNLGAKGWSLPA
jgi:homoserine kinase